MRIKESEFNIYQVKGLWHWDYGPFRSGDGFNTKSEARTDAEQFIGSFSEEEWRESEEAYRQEKLAMAQDD